MEFCLTIHDRQIRIWRIDFGNMARADIFTHQQYAILTHNIILIFIFSIYWHTLFFPGSL